MPSATVHDLVKLTGIARQAADGHALLEKNRVEYRTLPTRKWLNRCNSKRVPFHWTINPYRGCEYGCKYCYARFTHEYMELDADAFETQIYAKDWNGAEFAQELRRVKRNEVIGLGTATDPYQPAERKFGRTRQVLEALVGVEGIRLYVTTKSDLVARDADLFSILSERNHVRITVTVTTVDRVLQRLTEPFAPRPDLRLEAVRQLRAAGIDVGVIASPVLPLITDGKQRLESVASAARQAGATSFGAGVLFLKPSAQKTFFRFLEERYPHLLHQYQANYRGRAFLSGDYPDRIARTVEEIRREFGFERRDFSSQFLPKPPGSQLSLF